MKKLTLLRKTKVKIDVYFSETSTKDKKSTGLFRASGRAQPFARFHCKYRRAHSRADLWIPILLFRTGSKCHREWTWAKHAQKHGHALARYLQNESQQLGLKRIFRRYLRRPTRIPTRYEEQLNQAIGNATWRNFIFILLFEKLEGVSLRLHSFLLLLFTLRFIVLWEAKPLVVPQAMNLEDVL